MQKNKAETYVGFCVRAGKLTCGFHAVARQKKDVYLLLLCGTASENSQKLALKLRDRFGCELLLSAKKPLEEITGKANCKFAAVRHRELAKAILSASDDTFTTYSGGNR